MPESSGSLCPEFISSLLTISADGNVADKEYHPFKKNSQNNSKARDALLLVQNCLKLFRSNFSLWSEKISKIEVLIIPDHILQLVAFQFPDGISLMLGIFKNFMY